MTCLQCGGEMKSKKENYHYAASGLPDVTLMGVEVRRCAECGESEVAIPNIEGLHKALALSVARQPGRLAPAEIKFLRKYLGLSSVDFAKHIGVTPETVSRWESGVVKMGSTAERLLRWFIATREPVSDYPLDMFTALAEAKPRPARRGLVLSGSHWHESTRFASAHA